MASYVGTEKVETKYDKNGNIISQGAPTTQGGMTGTPNPAMDSYVQGQANKLHDTMGPQQSTTNPAVMGYGTSNPNTTPYDPTKSSTGATTQAGDLYAQRVTQGLQGNDPTVVNAQNTANTQAQARQRQATQATQQSLAQSPYAPGSAQYTRAMDRSQAQVNQANQAGQVAVNDYTRQTTKDNMDAAAGLETQTYNRGRDVKADAITERAYQDTKSLDIKNTLTTPQGKMAFENALATINPQTGKNFTPQEAYKNITNPDGSLQSQYQGQSPGALNVKGQRDEAEAWIKNTTGLQPGTPEFNKAVQDRLVATDTAAQTPVNNAKDTADLNNLKAQLATGKLNLSDPKNADALDKLVASGDIQSFGVANVPTGRKANELAGKTINVDGKFYTVVSGNKTFGHSGHHKDNLVVKDASGNTMYFYDKKLQSRPGR